VTPGPIRTDGWVYIIINPAWPGFIKLGSALGLRQRLNTYQTGSPYRDYTVAAAARFADCRTAEMILKDQLRGHRVGNTEWFRLHPIDARNHLKRLTKQESRQ